MGMVEITDKLLDFKEFRKFSDTFIETGSHVGTRIRAALDAGYTEVKSVEYFPMFYEKCVARFAGNRKVALFLGKSTDRLPDMLKGVDVPAVFWLDAHPSGKGTGGHDDLVANGDISEFAQDNILTKEIGTILAHRNDHVILIDDQFGPSAANDRYIEAILKVNPNYKFYFYDEQAGPTFYKNKSLACVPPQIQPNV